MRLDGTPHPTRRPRSGAPVRIRPAPWLLLAAAAFAAGCRDAPTDPGEAAPPPAAATAPAAQPQPFVPGQLLVGFQPGAPRAEVARAHGARLGRGLPFGIQILHVPEGRERAAAEALSRNPNVVFAEPDWIRTFEEPPCDPCELPGDELLGYKWDLHNDGTINSASGSQLAVTGAVDADIDWLEAFNYLQGRTVPGSARIGILDTGIRKTHDDLNGPTCSKLGPERDFLNGDNDATDDQGHGTHVAGISGACGANDGVGLAGVAYLPSIDFAIAKTCGPIFPGFPEFGGTCSSSAVVDGVAWAVDNGASVLNMSFGGTESSEAERVALADARARGVLPFCAAGNDGGAVLYPAAFDECVAVSATDWSDGLASYSNFGPQVELSAPGGDFEDSGNYSQIPSTCYGFDDNYCLKAGTSMATPQAAGLGALLYAVMGVSGPDADDEVLARLKATADDLGPAGPDDRFGAGRINAFNAVNGLLDGDPSNAAPVVAISSPADGSAFDPGETVSFAGTATDAEDGDLSASIAWTSSRDGAIGSGAGFSTASLSVGTHTITARVTDTGGRSGSDQISLTIRTTPPTVTITSPADGSVFEETVSVPFAGSASDAEDGDISASISWSSSLDGTFGSGASVSTDALSVGVHTITATVTDSHGATDSDTITVEITGFPNPPPPASHQVTATATTTSVRWTAAWTPPESFPSDSIEGYFTRRWTTNDAERTELTTLLTRTQNSGAPPAGTTWEYHFCVRTQRLGGARSAELCDFVAITLPEVAITGPADGSSFSSGETISFTGTATDAEDGDLGAAIVWSSSLDGAFGTGANVSTSSLSAGTHTITATVTDSHGAPDSDAITVTVASGPPPANQPPTAAFSFSCTDLSCAFTDGSSDPDDGIASWSWSFGDGGTSTQQNPAHAYAAAGTYTVTLTVTDASGATDQTSQPVTVSEPPSGGPPPPASLTVTADVSRSRVKWTATWTPPENFPAESIEGYFTRRWTTVDPERTQLTTKLSRTQVSSPPPSGTTWEYHFCVQTQQVGGARSAEVCDFVSVTTP